MTVRYNYTREELFMSVALNLLFTGGLYSRQKTAKYLKNMPSDVWEDSRIKFLHRILLDIIGNCNGELLDQQALIDKTLTTVANIATETKGKKISFAWFTNLLSIAITAEVLVSVPILHNLAAELVLKWKEKKKKLLKQILTSSKDLSEEELHDLIQEFIKIEQYSPFPEEQESAEADLLLSLAARPEDFNINYEYLYPDFLPEGTINFWVAPPSQGKSALALALACHLLDTNKVEKVFYFDGDNKEGILIKRNVPEIISKYQGKLFYYTPRTLKTPKDFQKLVKQTLYIKEKALIIIDTLRAFVGPRDINKGEIAEKIMSFFNQLVTDNKKTIIILHHVNKPPQNGSPYLLMDRIKGATEFRDRADLVFFITNKKFTENWRTGETNEENERNEELLLVIENTKQRIPVKNKLFFRINVEKARLSQISTFYTKDEEKFIIAAVRAIYNYEQSAARHINKYKLEKEMQVAGFGRNQTRNWLSKFNGNFWRQSWDGMYNQIIFKLTPKGKALLEELDKKPVIDLIEFEDAFTRNYERNHKKSGKPANWQTGEQRNNADSEDLTPEQKKAIESWGTDREKEKIKQSINKTDRSTEQKVHPDKATPDDCGLSHLEVKHNCSSPHLEVEHKTRINCNFASSPPSPSSPLPSSCQHNPKPDSSHTANFQPIDKTDTAHSPSCKNRTEINEEVSEEELIEMARAHPDMAAVLFEGIEDQAPEEVRKIIKQFRKERNERIKTIFAPGGVMDRLVEEGIREKLKKLKKSAET